MKNNPPHTPFPILRLGVDLADTASFLRAARASLPGGWSCAGEWPALFAYPLCYLHFRRRHAQDQPTSYVYLLRTDPDTLSVVGVVPDTGAITPGARHALLDDFRVSVLDSPPMRRFPISLVHPEPVAEFPPPPEVQKVLDRWSEFVNHGAGFHPFDATSWQDFLVALHLKKRSVTFDWLIDAFSLKHTIPERALERLEDRFYSSMELLRRHDEGLEYQREVALKRATAGPDATLKPSSSTLN